MLCGRSSASPALELRVHCSKLANLLGVAVVRSVVMQRTHAAAVIGLNVAR
jgi:hypothetical protein